MLRSHLCWPDLRPPVEAVEERQQRLGLGGDEADGGGLARPRPRLHEGLDRRLEDGRRALVVAGNGRGAGAQGQQAQAQQQANHEPHPTKKKDIFN